MRVRWLRIALRDLDSQAAYIATQNPVAAKAVVARVHEAIDNLKHFPLSGRSGRVSGTREFVVSKTSLIIAYRLDGQTIVILRVLHGRQRWPHQF